MADRVTGFGRTIEEFEDYECVKTMGETYEYVASEMRNDRVVVSLFDSLDISDGGVLFDEDDELCKLDEYGYELLGKCVGIPTAYLNRLSDEMKITNIMWWFGQMRDKEVTLRVRDSKLVGASVGIEIQQADVLKILDEQCADWSVINIANMTNSVQIDLVDLENAYATNCDTYSPGIRVIVRRGLNAPVISPIFLNQDSCAIVDLGEPDDEFSIKGFSYDEILALIAARVKQCAGYCEPSFKRFCGFDETDIPKPRRRASLYCREHGIPDRARAYVVDVFDELNITKATYGELVNIISSMPYSDGVSASTARRFQLVAGHIMSHGPKEGRCKACDAVMLEG